MNQSRCAGSAWSTLILGTRLAVVKLDPDGQEVTRYPGVVILSDAPAPWLAVESRWVNRLVEMDGLAIVPGDTLHEYFSPEEMINAFVVVAPDGHLRGWYANVTYPATVDLATDPPTLVWHDLFVDIVALPDGRVTVRDEDELAAAGWSTNQADLHAKILGARDELLARFAARQVPFHHRVDPVAEDLTKE